MSGMKIKPKNLLGMIMTVILIFSISAILYGDIIVTVEENFGLTVKEMKEKQFEDIWSSLLKFHNQAKLEVDIIASNIEDDIYSLSEDELKKLSFDMDNNIFNESYHNILISNIEGYNFNGVDNHQNSIVIMNPNGYVEDFNYRRAQKINEGHNHTHGLYREWECGMNNSYNKILEADAIDKLINRTAGIIATESYDITHIKDHIMIDELTYDTLLNVFLEEGLKGLQNYQIFVPHYITNVGDIFGTPDITHGVKVDNHKIIVVLEFNLYDQINAYYQNNNVNTDNLEYRYDHLIHALYVFGLVSVVTVVILMLYMCHMYNHLVLQEEMCCNDDEPEEP